MAAVLDAHEQGRPLALATSGTTGTSAREVIRSTGSWWASLEAYSALTGVRAGARVWIPGPLRGTMSLYAAVHARVSGASTTDSPAACTHACLTPAQLDRQGAGLASGTRVVVAGDTLPAALVDRAEGSGLKIAHYYGASELSFVAAGSSAEDLRAFPGVDIEIRDHEIWVRSPYLCQGYGGVARPLRFEESADESPDKSTAEPWATVGDLGELVDGRLVVWGRPDTVVTAGATVVLAEVEAELGPVARGSFAVVGVPHPVLGTVLAAVLTRASDRQPLQHHARTRLSASHRPRLWQVRDELPLTAAGKVDRAALVRGLR